MRAAIPNPVVPCLTALLLLTACDNTPAGVKKETLDDAVGKVIGDPASCMMIAEKGSGRIIYRWGTRLACGRELPECLTPGKVISADELIKLAVKGDDRSASCDFGDGASQVAWAAAPITPGPQAHHGELVYVVLMEGRTSPPGREIKIQLEPALARAGL